MATTTFHDYNGDGSDLTFNYTFPTYSQAEVIVEVSNVIVDNWTITGGWSATGTKEVKFDNTTGTLNTNVCESSGAPKAGTANVRIYRDTNVDSQKHTYQAGSALKAGEQNTEYTHLLRALQEEQNQTVTTSKIKDGAVTLAKMADNSVDSDQYVDGSIDSIHIAHDQIDSQHYADGSIDSAHISDNAIINGLMADNAIDSAQYIDGSIDSEHIANDQIDSQHYAAGSIDAEHIGNDQIDSQHYAADSIDSEHYAAGSVDGTAIANDAVDSQHYAAGSIDLEHMSANSVGEHQYVDASIKTAHIADDQIDSQHYAADSIDTEHYAPNSVDSTALAGDAVTAAQLADNAVDSEHYVDGSIDTVHIADTNVTLGKIEDLASTKIIVGNGSNRPTAVTMSGDAYISNAGAVTIANNAITSAKIANNTITAADLGADCVTSTNIEDIAVNSEHIAPAAVDLAHIENISNNSIIVGNASSRPTSVTMGGDATIANTGAVTIANDAITIAKIGCEQTTISDSDSHIPTSGAVVDYVASKIDPIGGLEVIADDESFPNTIAPAGVVISITDAAGLSVNSSGVSTNADTLDNSTVTINGFPSELRGGVGSNADPYVFQSGAGLMVKSTGSSQTYDYHQAMIRESDFVQLSDDINDFNARYRVNAGEPSSDNHAGDLVYDTNADKMKVRNAANSAWGEVTSTGDFKYLVMVNPGTTNAATLTNSTFDLKETSTSGSAASVTSAAQLIVSINGVIQKANTGTSAPAEGFAMSDADTIVFSSAPGAGASIFIVQIGSAVSIPTPGDGTVSTAKIAAGAVGAAQLGSSAVETAKIADQAVFLTKLPHGDGSSDGKFLKSNNGADPTWAAVPAGVGGATGVDFNDDVKIRFGTGNDAYIGFDITNDTADTLMIRQPDGEIHIRADNFMVISDDTGGRAVYVDDSNDRLELGHDGVADAYFNGGSITVIQDVTFDNATNAGKDLFWDMSDNALQFNDNVKATFGDGTDIQIYHDPSVSSGTSFIDNATGELRIRSQYVALQPEGGGEQMLLATEGGSVELYYDGTKKAETVTGGFTVTGTCTATAFAGDGSALTGLSAGVTSDANDNTLGGTNAGTNITSGQGLRNTFFGSSTGRYITTGDDNIAMGASAFIGTNSNAVTGSKNIAIGSYAFDAAISGDGNIAIGYGALTHEDDEDYNIAIGTEALSAQNGTSYNIAIGYQAGHDLDVGGSNIAIGREAMSKCNTVGARSNIGIGSYACNYIEGYGNSFVGDWAGGGSATTSGAAYYNVGIGQYALADLTTADSCVAVGVNALQNVVGGDYNTAVGESAGNDLVGGEHNTFVGRHAGYNVEDGYYNVAVGSACLNAVTTGGSNVAVGYNAGSGLTGSNYSIAIGRNTLTATCTENYNTGIGYQALKEVTSGYDNLAVGAFAGDAIDTGHTNTLFGIYAGTAISSGDYNTFIGQKAGESVSTGNWNIAIGRDAEPGSSTGDNQVVIYNGSVVADFQGSESSWTFTSDGRDKTDIVNLDLGLEFVEKLQPRKFTWQFRDEERCGNGNVNAGFIAQEVLEVIDEHDARYTGIVNTTDPENYKLGSAAMVPMLVNAVKELSAKVSTLETELAAIKGGN